MRFLAKQAALIGILWSTTWSAGHAAPLIDYRLYLGSDAGSDRGPVPITFTAYADSVGGAPLWRESHSPVAGTDGQVRLALGSVNPLPAAVLTRSVFWLEIRIRDDLLPARRKMQPALVPFGDTKADSARWNPVPPERLPDGRVRMLLIDFGLPTQEAPHRIGLGTDDRMQSLGWFGGPVRERTRRLAAGLYYCDFVEGHDASFAVAVDPPDGLYQVTLTLGDTESARGPADVLVGGRVVADKAPTRPGAMRLVTFDVKASGGRLVFRLRGRGCDPWTAVGLDLYGPPGARLTKLFPDKEPRDPVPPPARLTRFERARAREVLRSYCRFLMAERLTDGTFSSHGAWYENAYPIRTLLAGAEILGDPTWRQAAFECLDRFVEEQRPDGSWYSNYFGPRECRGGGEPDTLSANLADVGTMSLCLALAAPIADTARRERYLASAMRYADRIVLPAQLPSGAFPNGLYQGARHHGPYSVATATQAASLAALGAVSGKRKYSEAADRAGIWLAGQFRADGSVGFAAHDTEQLRVLSPTSFGDVFYLAEALTWVERHAARGEARTAARGALDRFLWGSQGLKASSVNGYWWKPEAPWVDAKMGGMLYVLSEVGRWSSTAPLTTWMQHALSWLAAPDLSRQIGVTAPLPSRTGLYGTTATGIAGIGVANLIDPGVFYPAGSTSSPPDSYPPLVVKPR